MKKKVIIAAALAGIVATQAQAAAPHTGFSVGANLGHTSVDGKLNRFVAAIGPNGSGDNSNFGGRTPVVGLFLGYGWAPNPHGVYLGGELFGQYENINAKREDFIPQTNFSMQLRTTNTFGAAAKIGFICKDALFYAKVGIASTKWKLSFTDLTPPPLTVATNSRKSGFLLGIGTDYAVARNWTLGGEYLYTTFGSLKLAVASGLNGTFSYKPKVSTFNLRLKYTF